MTDARRAALPERAYLLKGLLSPGELSVWWGPPKCGKSFLLMSIGYAIAQGRNVFGRRVHKARVLYLACEGRSGLRGRIEALHARHGDTHDFVVIAEPLDLRGTGGTDALLEIIPRAKFDLVVVDTLNRVMAGGDENSSADMGAVIRNLDHIRAETGAHVAVIHQGTKTGTGGPRGHGSLIGAADVIVEIAKTEDGGRSATVTDAKDDASDKAMGFVLEVVELGADADGDARTTCVVVERGAEAGPRKRPANPLTAAQGEKGDDHKERQPEIQNLPDHVTDAACHIAPSYDAALDELIGWLSAQGAECELANRVRRSALDNHLKLFAVVLQGRVTPDAKKVPIHAEPSNLFLRLLAAIRTSDDHAIGVVEHELRS